MTLFPISYLCICIVYCNYISLLVDHITLTRNAWQQKRKDRWKILSTSYLLTNDKTEFWLVTNRKRLLKLMLGLLWRLHYILQYKTLHITLCVIPASARWQCLLFWPIAGHHINLWTNCEIGLVEHPFSAQAYWAHPTITICFSVVWLPRPPNSWLLCGSGDDLMKTW